MNHFKFMSMVSGQIEVKFNKPLEITLRIKKLLQEAKKDPYIGDQIQHHELKNLVVIYHEEKAVGFAFPYQQKDYWKTGPLYVKLSHRGEGIGSSFLLSFYKGKKGKVYIDDDNTASQRTHEKAGFTKTEAKFSDDAGPKHLYVKEW